MIFIGPETLRLREALQNKAGIGAIKSQIGALFVYSRKWRTTKIIATMEDTTKAGTIV